jgi:multidrug transporter EmrE-like cation transporter
MNINGLFHEIKSYFSSVLIILSVIFQSLAIISGKYAAITLSNHAFISLISNMFYIASLGFYILQAIVWQQVLIQHSLSVAYLFMSSVNFIILFCSVYLFKEGITIANIIGILLITIGISLIIIKFEET